jgi:hypothetical protein
MPNLNTNLSVAAILQYSNAVAGNIGTAALAGADRVYSRPVPDGSTSGQANKLFQRKKSLTTATNDDFDLAGALVDDFGQALVFSVVMGLILKADDANTGNLTLGGATNAWASAFGAATHTLVLQPKGLIVLVPGDAGYAVTAATADILRVGNASGATQAYELTLIGR